MRCSTSVRATSRSGASGETPITGVLITSLAFIMSVLQATQRLAQV
jgi:hypothetical protein